MNDRLDAGNAAAVELGRLLRGARLRAGLTQRQVAAAAGLGGRYGHTYVHRLEKGAKANPALWLVLDVLRACRATRADIAPFLDPYLGEPLPVPESGPRAGRGPRPEPADPALLALRQEALEWKLRVRFEEALYEELNRLGVAWPIPERRLLAAFGRKVFRALFRTRGAGQAARASRLARAWAWAEARGLDDEMLAGLGGAVVRLFAAFEKSGDLDRLPLEEEARALLARSPRRRVRSDDELCRRARVLEMAREQAARQAARQPVVEAARRLLAAEGLSAAEAGNYAGFVLAFLGVAERAAPGSEERAERVVRAVTDECRPHHDPELVRRLAELVYRRWDARPGPGPGPA